MYSPTNDWMLILFRSDITYSNYHQPRRISQEGTEDERIPPPRPMHDPVVLGQRLLYSAVAFRRDAVNPGTAAC
jgi:hypothetical protein